MKVSQAENVVEFYGAYTSWSIYRTDCMAIDIR